MNIRGSVWRSLDWKTKLGTCVEHEPHEPRFMLGMNSVLYKDLRKINCNCLHKLSGEY
jgi:hypothetical protein